MLLWPDPRPIKYIHYGSGFIQLDPEGVYANKPVKLTGLQLRFSPAAYLG